MKKVTLWSLIITAFMFVVNLLLGLFLKVSIGPVALDYNGSVGFGVRLENAAGQSPKVSFDPVTLIFTFVFIFVLASLVHLTVKGFKTMKKGTICALIVTGGLFVFNFLCGVLFGFTFGIPIFGGEIVQFIGYGVFHSEISGMTEYGQPPAGRDFSTYPEFITLMLTYAVVLGIAALVCRRKRIRAQKNAKKENEQ